jgi:hypothetical protein
MGEKVVDVVQPIDPPASRCRLGEQVEVRSRLEERPGTADELHESRALLRGGDRVGLQNKQSQGELSLLRFGQCRILRQQTLEEPLKPLSRR